MSSLLKLYARPAQLFTHGNGCYLFDSNSKKYLDFTSGIAVNALGHNHPGVVDVISKQSKKLIHLSNLYHGEHAESLASKMVHGLDGRLKDAKVFFCNSGAEANEGAFKFAKKYAKKDNLPNKNGIISFSSGFHGRTFGALSATPNPKYQTPFLPLLPHFQSIKFNDAGALNTINDDTAAVIVEPLQGEGGVFPIDPNFFRQLREKCDQHNVVLICDEIQCGIGRTGSMYCFKKTDVVPDIVTMAKPIANGLPMGAVVVSDDIAKIMTAGDHGTTFGGSPLTTAVANYVWSVISEPKFLKHVKDMGTYSKEKADSIIKKSPLVKQFRGQGLLMGLEFRENVPNNVFVDHCRDHGLLVVGAGNNTARLLPPLIVQKEEIDEAFDIISTVLLTM